MAEPRLRTRDPHAQRRQGPEGGVPAELAERDDDPDPVEGRELAEEVRRAVVALVDGWLVRRWSAAHRRADSDVGQRESIVRSSARWPVGEPGPMERRPQEVAARVAGEHPPGPVAAVRRRREAEDEDPGVRVAEARQWPAPVRLVAEARDLLARHQLPPGDETRAAEAADDVVVEAGQRGSSRLWG